MEAILIIIPLIIGYILDLTLGDPRWLPHPIRFYGRLIAFGESKLNRKAHRFFKGLLLTIILTSGSFLFFWFAEKLLNNYRISYFIFSSIFVFYSLANRSLIDEGKAVFKALKKGLPEGRLRLSWIVGRDTSQLDNQQIKTAVFETLSENLSDGVIAPLFYYAILGVPGAMLYKMVNTLDSMIGYKNERYFYFGKFAAKLDDVFNWIPARLTAFLMLLVSYKLNKIPFVIRYGNQHSSPNAGYPEAALAAILDCRFGGPNYYHGELVEKPYIGDSERALSDDDIHHVARINHKVTALSVFIICIVYYFVLC